jgi:hypothetical protein
MTRRAVTAMGDRIGQSLQAAQQMLVVCDGAADGRPGSRRPLMQAIGSQAPHAGRKCRSVQFGLVPQDFHRLRQISDKLGWSRAELARRCLLLVMECLEDQYPELQGTQNAALEDGLRVEQLSLWPEPTDPAANQAPSSS